MTIARDIKTGAVVGQVVGPPLIGEESARVLGIAPLSVRILTADGYRDIPRTAVRLEEISDR